MVVQANASCTSPGGGSRSGIDAAEIEQLVHSLKPRLESLAGASLLFTGATGWFGTWLLDLFCAADDAHGLGLRISAVSRDPAAFLGRFPAFAAHPAIRWIKTDIRDLEPIGRGFTHVVHAATDSSERRRKSTPQETFTTIVGGTRRALAAAGTSCRSFLMLSSGAVYGPVREDRSGFCEDDPCQSDPALPGNAYGDGKRAAEEACAIAATDGIPVRIARCFAFVGPHMPFDQHFAIGNFIADAVDGRAIRVRSDGRPLRSYLYMSDLVRALIAILVDGAVARPYNVGSEFAVTIEELARRVSRIAGGGGVLIEGQPSNLLDRYVPDVTRIKTELGFTEQVPLDDAIARTATWRRTQQQELMRS